MRADLLAGLRSLAAAGDALQAAVVIPLPVLLMASGWLVLLVVALASWRSQR
jgi:hypothetical protein